MSSLRSVDFADLEAGVWGGVWSPPGAGRALAYVGLVTGAPATAVEVTLTAHDERWDIALPGGELTVAAFDGQSEEPARICRVTGAVTLADGTTQEIDCLGARSTRAIPTEKVDSIREVAAWLGEKDGFSLVAVRPKGARGHEADAIECTHFEAGAIEHVDEPRLSSTYRADGTLVRAGVELWLTAPPEDGDDDEQEPLQYPRRAAAVATGAATSWAVPELQLAVRSQLCRWAARGLEGAGVYRLVTRA